MTTITALPSAPSTSSPSTFDALADTFVAALPTLVTEINIVAGEVVTNRDAAAASNTSAAGQVTAAQAQATSASASATAAAASTATALSTANFKGEWSAVGSATVTLPWCVYYNGSYWQAANAGWANNSKTPGISVDWLRASVTYPGAVLYTYINFGGL